MARVQSIQQEQDTDVPVYDSDIKAKTKTGTRLVFSEEKILGASDALEIIFPNLKTQTAARIFVKWLKEKDGQASRNAVSIFADQIQSGMLDTKGRPFHYSKRNFYMTVLKTLISMGFIRRNVPIWDEHGKRTLYVYMKNIFDIPQKPPSVGFWRLSYYIAKKWNKMFLE